MGRNYSNWLNAYVTHTQDSEAPTAFHFWTGVSTIAGALRRRVWIDQRHFQWTPNFYVILVAKPGVATKSTSLKIGMSMLEEIEGINFGPNSMTWQALVKAFEDSAEMVPLDDVTENPLTAKYEHMSCITCSVGELGTFFDPADRKMTDVLTDLWDGQKGIFRHSTKTQGGVQIENPWLNVIAATTPSWIAQNVPESMIGGGLTSRMLFVFASDKRKLIAYPSEVTESDLYEEERAKLVEDLKDIAKLKGEMRLSPEAIQLGSDWYTRHWKVKPESLASERFEGYLARKQTHIHKLAIALSAAESNELIITAEQLDLAITLVTALEEDMLSVFQSIGKSDTGKHLIEILAYLRVYKTMESRTLWRQVLANMQEKEFVEAIDAGIRAGYLAAGSSRDGVNSVYSITKEGLALGSKKQPQQQTVTER